jgi:metal-sulfur cluster biosynthetic enzyme
MIRTAGGHRGGAEGRRRSELGINVVDLGLVYGLHLEDDDSLTIDMTLTSAACPLTDVIEDQTRLRSRDWSIGG